ncbi:hypothetical protein BDB00DRAFT_763199 [Zychaea mexicana]|uniref:uncharacterized protein n=1 Tax=Zychaea mexicana TaxID=64656 RepID=UPI0022FEC470|nr:uncharacterized protein BDB00DRAFT_763199 [Zychaea mexicana]KAI9493648.1 hypothetical protein BDB00DRAFT_763199 [Zychaea mexicana]
MSGKNYNVLVDMDDGGHDYSQPATIESDGLEFQDFSNSAGNNTSAPPPPPPSGRTGSFFDTQQQQQPTRSSGTGKPVWSLDYYSQFFDVDTSQVLERCLKTVYPVGDFANDTLNNQPDLYGPFWISTTVVFALFVCSSLAGSLAAYIANVPHESDFRLLSYAVGVVYTYGFLCPALVWAATKYFGCQPSLLEIINYYGYGLTIWIPVSTMPPTSRRQQKILEKQKQEAAHRKQKASSYVNQAPFRYAERNFKSRVPPPDFSKVVDLDHRDSNDPRIIQIPLPQKLVSPHFAREDSNAFLLKDIPGLIIIQNPFTDKAQRHFIRQCLSLYSQAPNTSNLDTHYTIPADGLWNLCEREHRGELEEGYCIPRKDRTTEQDASSDEEKKKQDPPPVETVPLMPPSQLIYKMRWITLGYQYHWPTKTYHFDRRYDVPEQVDALTRAVVTAVEGVGHDGWKNTYRGADYKTEAGVVNYYQYRDTLMGHVDRSELNMQAPLVSIRYNHTFVQHTTHVLKLLFIIVAMATIVSI